MGVYIPSLKMPQTCEDCVLESYCSLWVDARRLCGETFTDTKSRIEATIRHPDCPLIEVKPHGRLIDADALDYTMLYKENWMRRTGVEAPAVWKSDIDATTTIIEAEEVYGQYTDTAGNFHWCGTHSGEHTIKAEEASDGLSLSALRELHIRGRAE